VLRYCIEVVGTQIASSDPWKDIDIQWNFFYVSPLGPGVVHMSEKSVSLKLNIKLYFNYPNRAVTTLIEEPFQEFG